MSSDQHILFITSSRIGDAVLSTGILNHLHDTNPEARFTICCGPLAVSLFEGFPNVDRVIAIKKEKHHKHWLKLLKEVIGTKFDIVVDLRNSAVSRLVRARKRYIYGKQITQSLHKVEQNAAVLKLMNTPAPKLWFSQKQLEFANNAMGQSPNILGVGPAANWPAKTWPIERFIEITQWLMNERHIEYVAVFAAPGEESIARQLLQSISQEKQIDMIAKTDPGTAAACLSKCYYYIGNDSGLMHCAAAVGVQTIGLFGPSYPSLYRPWGKEASYVSTPETFDELIDYDAYRAQTAPCLMESLAIDTVKAHIQKNWLE
ncbi:MAG: glycosyltransferase family 9 protein [Alphaproteobacteria bacterium]|nr:glycosyltransferase family 9 protein [Alphaproteobacteria bacterium]